MNLQLILTLFSITIQLKKDKEVGVFAVILKVCVEKQFVHNHFNFSAIHLPNKSSIKICTN